MQMESQVSGRPRPLMELRKVLKFNSVLGLTLPKAYTNNLELEHHDYVEVSLSVNKTITIKKHLRYRPNKDPYGRQPITTT